MGHIKEPIGINLIVDPKPLTKLERELISKIVAYYKKTGKKKNITSLIEITKSNSIQKKEN